jgi:hypothetical protein
MDSTMNSKMYHILSLEHPNGGESDVVYVPKKITYAILLVIIKIQNVIYAAFTKKDDQILVSNYRIKSIKWHLRFDSKNERKTLIRLRACH